MDVFNVQASIGLDISAFEQQLSEAMAGAEKLTDSFESAVSGADQMQQAVNNITAAFGLSNASVTKGTEYYNALQTQLEALDAESQRAADKVEAVAYAMNQSAAATGADSEETRALAQELAGAEAEASRLQSQANALRTRLESAAEATSETGYAANDAKTRFQEFKEGFVAFTGVDRPFGALKEKLSAAGDTAEKIAHPFRTLISHMDEAAASAKLQRDRIASLEASYNSAKKNVEALSDEYRESVKQTGAASEQSRELERRLSAAEGEMQSAKSELDKYNKEVDETDDKSKEASESSHKFGDALKSVGSVAASAVAGIAKMSAAAIAAGGAAVAGLAKDALGAYSTYEQLVGGVQTIFGAQGMTLEQYASSVGKTTDAVKKEYDDLTLAQDIVLKNADKAYATAGLSANQYIDTVTSFSASLLQSLDGDTIAAAKKADVAIRDMADNANKMGTSMESIQNAYQGFAKQNFSMLDNLKLGYGGTQEEMYRLMEDAAKLNKEFAKNAEFSLDSKGHLTAKYSDIVDAIHIVQENMHMSGLSAEEAAEMVEKGLMTQEEAYARMGTTAKEASGTIEGSVRSMGAAWENVKTNLATGDDEKVSKLIDILVQSIETAANNIVPRLETILDGVAKMVDKLAPIIAEKLPGLVSKILPAIISAGTQLIQSVVKQLPSLIRSLLPPLLSGIRSVISAIREVLPDIMAAIREIIPELVSSFVEALPLVLEIGGELLMALVDGIIENVDGIISAAVAIIQKLSDGIIKNLPKLVSAAIDILIKLVDAITKNIDMIIRAAVEIVTVLAKSLLTKDNLTRIIHAAVDLMLALAKALTNQDTLDALITAIPEVITAIVDALIEAAPEVITAAIEIIGELADGLLSNLGNIFSAGWDIIQELIKGISAVLGDLWDAIAGIGEELGTKVYDWVHDAYEWGKDLIENFIDGVKQKWEEHKKFWEGFGEYIYDYLHHSTPEKGPLKDDDKWGGDLMDNFIEGAAAKEKELSRTFAGIAQTAADALAVDTPSIDFGGAVQAAQGAQKGIQTMGTILDVQFDMDAIGAMLTAFREAASEPVQMQIDSTLAAMQISEISETPVTLKATLDTSAVQDEISNLQSMSVSIPVSLIGYENFSGIMIQKIDEALREFQLQQTRGIGGVSWQ